MAGEKTKHQLLTIKLRATVGIMVLMAIVYAGVWYTVAFETEDKINAQFKEWRKTGSKISKGSISVYGFPYRIMLDIEGLAMRTPGRGLDIKADKITLTSHVWTPSHWLMDMVDADIRAGNDIFHIKDPHLRASYRVHEGGKAVTVIEGKKGATRLLDAPLLERGATLETFQIFLRTAADTGSEQTSGLYEDPSFDFKLVMQGTDGGVMIDGNVAGPSIDAWDADNLANWRDEGGLINMPVIDASFAGTTLKGDGSLSLDERFRPLGSISLEIGGTGAIKDLLKEYDIGSRDNVNRAVPDGRSNDIPLSIMLQMGAVSIDGERMLPLKSVLN